MVTFHQYHHDHHYCVILTCPGSLVKVDGDGVVAVEEGGVGGGTEGHTHPIAETARAHTDRRQYLNINI